MNPLWGRWARMRQVGERGFVVWSGDWSAEGRLISPIPGQVPRSWLASFVRVEPDNPIVVLGLAGPRMLGWFRQSAYDYGDPKRADHDASLEWPVIQRTLPPLGGPLLTGWPEFPHLWGVLCPLWGYDPDDERTSAPSLPMQAAIRRVDLLDDAAREIHHGHGSRRQAFLVEHLDKACDVLLWRLRTGT